MSTAIETLFEDLQLRPVVMDIGATGEAPPLWNEIAPYATYVGVGPASSPSGPGLLSRFRKTHLVERIVTAREADTVSLHIMRDPIYSSVFEANPQAMMDFLDPHLEPQGEESLPATTIEAILRDLSLPRVEWLHTNVNGVDYPLFESLSEELKGGVVALDSCLNLVELCVVEESSVARYPEIIQKGFWLSRAFNSGPIRMRQPSLQRLHELDPAIDEKFVTQYHRRSPGWVFVRFFRTLGWLAERRAPPRDYALLWSFALIDGQFGFCTDLLLDYERRFGRDPALTTMERETVSRLKALQPRVSLQSATARYLPGPVRRGLRRFLGRGMYAAR